MVEQQIEKLKKVTMLGEFRTFILRGNVVDLAIGVIAGAAFSALVKSLVENIFMPIITAIIGKPDYTNLHVTVNHSVIGYGTFLTALITFLLTMAAVFYFIVKPINVMTRRFAPPASDGEPEQRECPDCLSDVPARARRCMYCTTALTPLAGPGAATASEF
jgi:large conductance mechanosensitive channel